MEKIYNNSDSSMRRWLGGIPYEIAYWRSYYGNSRKLKDLFRWSCYDKEFNLEDFDLHSYVRELNSSDPIILDVGSSLSYMLGNIIDGKKRDIQYIDPLATFYNDILKKYHILRPQIRFGMIEALSASFSSSSVDFIHVRNALDHCANPMAGIIQSLNVLKVGGVLYLNHHPNEAEGEDYRGFHQFNIIDVDGRLIIWNKEQRLDVAKILEGIATVKVSRSKDGNVVAVITKTAQVPLSIYSDLETMRYLAEAMQTIMHYFHTFPNSFWYQVNRLYTSVGHRLVRMLPYDLIHFLKRLASHK